MHYSTLQSDSTQRGLETERRISIIYKDNDEAIGDMKEIAIMSVRECWYVDLTMEDHTMILNEFIIR